MRNLFRFILTPFLLFFIFGTSLSIAQQVTGTVQAGGSPVVNSTITLWAASQNTPRQIAQAKSDNNGLFSFTDIPNMTDKEIFYLIAQGGQPKISGAAEDNKAIALMTTLNATPPAKVMINELTTVASVWTAAQFLEGPAMSGNVLGLRIAAGNVPNLVNIETGGYGSVIQDGQNSTQTPTMANFATLATLLAGCTTQVKSDSCSKLFAAATTPRGKVPTDTLLVAEAIAHNPSHNTDKLFALLNDFYPVPKGKTLRNTPYLPYLSVAPSSWLLGLKFTGGGVNAPGKIMFDSKGNAWTGDNFIVGSQGLDALWDGNMSQFAPNGQPLSPMTTGFHGGGLEGPGFGTAITSDDKVWITSTNGKTISLFDKNGQPLSPPEGYNFNGKLGLMQGIIVTPSGDVWALDFSNNQVIYMPQGDPSKVKFFCQSTNGNPKDNPCKLNGPFHLAIDQQERIWITNAISDTVTRFLASDPSKIEVFKAGHSGKGIAIDSQGNAWITNTAGDGLSLITKLQILVQKWRGKSEDEPAVYYLTKHKDMGNVTMLRPDGSQAPGSPFNGGGSTWGPWAVAIDGNDQVWISNFGGQSITHLCGARTETCPPGLNTGDPISPAKGYVGGGMQMLTDIAIDPAGNVWVANNWQDPASCFGKASEAQSTRCGGNGLTVFYGMAKPVRVPLIGPPRAP